MASKGPGFPVHLSINGGTYGPYGVVTDGNHGSYVIIDTWIFACISVLFVAVRVILRTWTARHFSLDNGLIVAALCFAIGQSIASSESVRLGLGRHSDTLNEGQIRSFYRAIFASDILSVFVFVLSKLSLLALLSQITPSVILHNALGCFTVFTVLWGTSNIFSMSFRCGARIPMKNYDSQCVDERALILAHGTINIVTDFLIVIFPIFIMWKTKLKMQQKLIVLGLFVPRIAVCVSTGIQLSTLELYFSGSDPTWNYLYPSLWNQMSTHLSIITACVPSIKPFFDSLQSSLIDSGIPRNYSLNALLGRRLWRTSENSSGKSSQRFRSSLQGNGLKSTTFNEIEGGLADDHAIAAELSESAIHQQRDVHVEFANVQEDSAGSNAFSLPLPIQKP